MFKRSFLAAAKDKERAGKARKATKRSFRDDATKARLHAAATSPAVSSPGSSPTLHSAIVTIAVGAEKRLFAAHEEALAGSPVLAAACRAQFWAAPGERRIALPEEEPVVFAAVLEFLYTREYAPRLRRDAKRDVWYLEDDGPATMSRTAATPATIYHRAPLDAHILRDTAIYCLAGRLQLPELQRLALRKQGLVRGADVSLVLRSAMFAYEQTADSDARLRAHYLALIIRGRKTFARSGAMQAAMAAGGSALFFDVFVAMCNHVEDLVEAGYGRPSRVR